MLPSIDDGGTDLEEVTVQIDSLLAGNVELGDNSLSLAYDGKVIAGLTTEIKVVKIGISLVNSVGTNSYDQTVIVYPSQEETSQESEVEAEVEIVAEAEQVPEEESETT